MPGVLDYLDEQISAIKKHTAAALEAFDEKGVHQARVGTRRLKAGLDLLSPITGKTARPLDRAGKTLRKRLGPLRDLDVMINGVGGMTPPARLTPAVEWLAGHLDHARRDARLDDQEEGKSPFKLLAKFDDWPAVRQTVEAAADAVGPLLVEALHAQFADFRNEADWVSKIKDPPADHGPINVHAVRINGKALRYTLEIAAAHGLDVPDRVFKTFKAMQESLGDWHDGVVLAEETMRFVLDAELPLHDPELAAGVLDLVKQFLRQSNAALNQFRAQWTRGGAGLEATLKERVPLIQHAASTPSPSPATPSADTPGPVEQGTISTGAT